MNGYHELDGIPCAGSKELLTDILRGEWGFDGTLVSDYFAITMLDEYHHVSSTKLDAASLALEAGIDIELPFTDCLSPSLNLILLSLEFNRSAMRERTGSTFRKKVA